jgi:hypothetical protein
MVLISIHPFAVRKLFLIIVALLCFSAVCFADPVLMVRRFSSPAERLAGMRVLGSTWQEPAAGGLARNAGPYFAHFESANLAERQPMAASIDGSKRGVLPAASSYFFRSASCALRSNGPMTIPDGLTLRESVDI